MYLKNGYFSPAHAWIIRGFFSDIHCADLLKLPGIKTQKSGGRRTMTRSPRSFYLSDLSKLSLWQFVNYSAFLYPGTDYYSGFSSALISCDSLYSLLVSPNLEAADCLLHNLTFLRDLRRVADFLVCSAFYLWGWYGDFQTSCMLDWKSDYIVISAAEYYPIL